MLAPSLELREKSMKYFFISCMFAPSLTMAVMDNEVRNLSEGQSSGDLIGFIGFIISIIFIISMIKLLLNVAWNSGIKRKVNIPNYPLHMKVANGLLDYESGVDLNTWVTKEEAALVQTEVNRLQKLEQENLAEYYKVLNELESAKRVRDQSTN